MRVRGRSHEVPAATYEEHVIRRVELGLRERIALWDRTRTRVPPEDEVVAAMLDSLTLTHAPTELGLAVGPFYDTAGVMKLLGNVTKQAVDDRRRKAGVLALRTSDGKWVYPTFQFSNGEVAGALLPAVRALRDCPAWSVAQWFVTENDDLDGMSPIDWAKADLPAEPLTRSARHTAAEWA